jgi:hypothetical protein
MVTKCFAINYVHNRSNFSILSDIEQIRVKLLMLTSDNSSIERGVPH